MPYKKLTLLYSQLSHILFLKSNMLRDKCVPIKIWIQKAFFRSGCKLNRAFMYDNALTHYSHKYPIYEIMYTNKLLVHTRKRRK